MKKILYLECKTGAAGDMLMGALYSIISGKIKCDQRRSVCDSTGNMQTGNRWDSYEGGDQWYRRRDRSTSPP